MVGVALWKGEDKRWRRGSHLHLFSSRRSPPQFHIHPLLNASAGSLLNRLCHRCEKSLVTRLHCWTLFSGLWPKRHRDTIRSHKCHHKCRAHRTDRWPAEWKKVPCRQRSGGLAANWRPQRLGPRHGPSVGPTPGITRIATRPQYNAQYKNADDEEQLWLNNLPFLSN